MRVAFNDKFLMLFDLPRYASASEHQVTFSIITFDALIRKQLFAFISLLAYAKFSLVKSLFYFSLLKTLREHAFLALLYSSLSKLILDNTCYNLVLSVIIYFCFFVFLSYFLFLCILVITVSMDRSALLRLS